MLTLQRTGGLQYSHINRSSPLAANLVFAALEPFSNFGHNLANGGTGYDVNGTPGLPDCTPWGMLAFGCDGSTFRALRYYFLPEVAPFTYACFCRFDSASATAMDALSRGDVGTHNGAFSLGIGSTALRFRAALRLGGTMYTAQMSTSVNAREWYFIAITYDNADLRLYVDGQNVATTNIGLSFTASNHHLRLGARSTGTANWLGAVGASFGWTRLLSEAELVQVSQDLNVSWLTGWEPPSRVWFVSDITGGTQYLSVGSAVSDEQFGVFSLTPGAVTISPNSSLSDEQFGAFSLSQFAAQNLAVGSVSSEEAFGRALATAGAVVLSIGSVPSEERFGALAVAPGSVSIFLGGRDSEERFGRLALSLPGGITPTRLRAQALEDSLRAQALPRIRAKTLEEDG